MVTAVRGTASSTYRIRLTLEPELNSVTFIPKRAWEGSDVWMGHSRFGLTAANDEGRKTIVRLLDAKQKSLTLCAESTHYAI